MTSTLDSPIPYMQRTREYYLALGYDAPYRWAHNESAPFQHINNPIRHHRTAASREQ